MDADDHQPPCPDEPDSNRRAGLAIGAAFFANGVTAASWLPRLPEIRDRIDVSTAALGLVLLGLGVGAIVGSALSGRLIERVGSRASTIGAAVVLAAITPLVAVAGSGAAMFGVLVFVGAFDGLNDVSMNAQAVALQRIRSRSVMTRIHGLWTAGALVGGLLAALAADTGLALEVHLVAVAIALLGLAAAIHRDLLPRSYDAPATPEITPAPAARRRSIALIALLGVTIALAEVPATDWAAVRLADDLSASAGQAGLAYAAFMAGMLLGRAGGDRVVDRLGADRARRLGSAIALAGLVGATQLSAVSGSLIGFAVVGFGISALYPLLFRAAGEIDGVPSARGFAAMSTGASTGVLIGPLMVGALAATTSVGNSLLIVTGVALLVLIAIPRIGSSTGSSPPVGATPPVRH